MKGDAPLPVLVVGLLFWSALFYINTFRRETWLELGDLINGGRTNRKVLKEAAFIVQCRGGGVAGFIGMIVFSYALILKL